jgi:hypothetical protein
MRMESERSVCSPLSSREVLTSDSEMKSVVNGVSVVRTSLAWFIDVSFEETYKYWAVDMERALLS